MKFQFLHALSSGFNCLTVSCYWIELKIQILWATVSQLFLNIYIWKYDIPR